MQDYGSDTGAKSLTTEKGTNHLCTEITWLVDCAQAGKMKPRSIEKNATSQRT